MLCSKTVYLEFSTLGRNWRVRHRVKLHSFIKALESVVIERLRSLCRLRPRSKQVFEQSCRANKLLGYIRRNTGFIRSTDVRRSVYTISLSLDLFSAMQTQIWAPQFIELITIIERAQAWH